MAELLHTANGRLALPSSVYKVKGNMINLRVPNRKHGDVLPAITYAEPINPHWGQKPIWEDQDTQQQILIAGSQGGKSHIGPEWMWREILKGLQKPVATGIHSHGIIGPSLNKMRQSTVGIMRMVRFFEEKKGWSEDVILNKQDLRIDLRSVGYQVQILSGSAERPGRLMGAHLESAWIDEAGEVADRAIYYTTLHRLHGIGRLLVTTTPYLAGAVWLKELLEKAESGESDDLMAVSYRSTVNPYFALEQEERQQRELPDSYFRMMYWAMFELPEGLVYPNVRYVEPFTIPRNWIRFMGIDPTHGGSDEFAAVWIAYDPYDPETWYIYREFYMPCTPGPKDADQRWKHPHEMLDSIYAMSVLENWNEALKEFDATENRENIGRIFIDPQKKETQMDIQMRFHEAQVFAADPKLAGIIDMGRVLKTGRLLVFNNLVNWRFEQTNYIYPRSEFGDKVAGKPRDLFNHLMDASRYAIRQCEASQNLAEPSFA